MDQQLKDEWCAALRSGDYKQGSMFLRSPDNKFCCLGVLINLVAPEEWITPKGNKEPYTISTGGDNDDGESQGDFPYNWQERVEIPSKVVDHLVELNDGTRVSGFKTGTQLAPYATRPYAERPKSFKEIADFIEENL